MCILLGGFLSVNNRNHSGGNFLHSFRVTNKPKSHEDVCKNHDYCHIKLSEKRNIILKLNQEQKFQITLFVIYGNT